MEWFKGYVTTTDKKCNMKFKDAELLSFEQVKDLPEYAGVLADNTILVDIDDIEQSEIMMTMVEDFQLNCRVYVTKRGRHFLFRNEKRVQKCGTHIKLACGLEADIKIGLKNSYEVLKYEGQDRFVEWDVEEGQEYDVIPMWMIPVKTSMDFLNMDAGEGRNSSLFSYELVLQSHGLTPEEARQTIKVINKYILKEPLSEDEINTITRDEAFAKPVFYDGKTFLHDQFALYMKSEFYIKRINGQLHVYKDGIYVTGYRYIENMMIQVIPTMRSTARQEVLKYLEIIVPDESYISDAYLIAFDNGILDLRDGQLHSFSPEYIITNKIPWNYNVSAYSEIADKTLNNISCGDAEIRMLLEECIGYTFFRQNELSKSFILTGVGSNGKSTYLDMIKHVLGRQNFVALDLDELSERFSTSTMFGKLANIGDDISDDFLQGKAISQFKKLVSGNDVKAENKGQDVFFFKPTVKLLFSANEIPRMRNKGFEAIKRRLVIVPFNAKFSKDDPNFDAGITWKLKTQEVAEYLIQIGLAGLQRVLDNQSFTESSLVEQQIDQFEKDNNPLILFLEEVDEDEILHHETKDVFLRYDVFCRQNGFTSVAMQTFSKEITRRLCCEVVQTRIDGRKVRVFK